MAYVIMLNLRPGRLFLVFAALVAVLFLSACDEDEVEVALHGVNYSADEFSYYVMDSNDRNKTLGGEYVAPFAAGGTVCCARLPKRWSAGTKLEIRTTHWKTNRAGGELLDFREIHIVDVPKYFSEKPGQLWVVRDEGGKIDVVSSDFQPDHPKWPGKIKGWPQPSLQYKREKWEALKNHQEVFVRNSVELLSSLQRNPELAAKNAWEFAQKNDPSSITGFSGPSDPKYVAALKVHYDAALKESQEQLKRIMEAQP